MVEIDLPDSSVTADAKRDPARITLDFATWRAHIAAPGSRFEPAAPSTPPRIVHLDAVRRAAPAADAERQTA